MKGDLLQGQLAKSEQLNAIDIAVKPITIKITGVKIDYEKEQPWSIFYEGDNGRPFKPSKGMRRVISLGWQTDDSQDLIGKSLKLFREPTVLYGGKQDGGIRISHMSDIKAAFQFPLQIRRGLKEPITIEPLTMAQKFTQSDAAGLIASCETIDALQAIWGDERIKPYKQVLKPMLDKRKAEIQGDDEKGGN